MAIRDVIKVPNPMLAQKSEEIKIIYKSVKKLVKDMFETMKKNNGRSMQQFHLEWRDLLHIR